MSTGIKAVGVSNLNVSSNIIDGFDDAIDLEKVKTANISNNVILSATEKNYELLKSLIENSNMSGRDKKDLIQTLIRFMADGAKDPAEKKTLEKALGYISNKAVDLFVQTAAAVAAGMVLRNL